MLLKVVQQILNVIRNNKYSFILVFILTICAGMFVFIKPYYSKFMYDLSVSRKYEYFKSKLPIISIAISNYSLINKHYMPVDLTSPRSGNPILSWRHLISPYISSSHDYELREAWDSPKSLTWRQVNTPVYCFPHQKNRKDNYTNIMAVTGPGTAFDPNKPTKYFRCPHNLIILAYVDKSQTHWMQPGDIQIGKELTTAVEAEIRSKMYFDGGVIVSFHDGEVWHLSKEIPVSVLFKFMTFDEYVYHSREKELTPYTINNYTQEDMMKKANE